jgi:hypothetical protein
MRAFIFGLVALFAGATPAFANQVTIDFTVTGPWTQYGSAPFGLTTDAMLSGSVTLDNASCGYTGQCDGQSVTAINWVTGTLAWTLSDISIAGSNAYFNKGGVTTLFLQSTTYGGENSIYLYYNGSNVLGTVGISNNLDASFYSSNVTGSGLGVEYPIATPLPAALPLFITGLGALGLLTWRRRRVKI